MVWQELASETATLSSVSRKNSEEPLFKPDAELLEQFETVNAETLLMETQLKIEELKAISEEFRRMKQLVDFRRPLLSQENS